jgi:hypothetical protein
MHACDSALKVERIRHRNASLAVRETAREKGTPTQQPTKNLAPPGSTWNVRTRGSSTSHQVQHTLVAILEVLTKILDTTVLGTYLPRI